MAKNESKDNSFFPPVLIASGESMPEAWEESFVTLNNNGLIYQRDDPKDNGDQLEAHISIEVRNPDSNPFSHLKGGTNAILNPLLDYYYEMMGAKGSCWLGDSSDSSDNKWDYTYNERLTEFPGEEGEKVNQVANVVKGLIDRPYSRRNNMITWNPSRDPGRDHTPCLQRAWFQIIPGEDKDNLDMSYSFRSRNVTNASFGNMMGLYILGCDIRNRVEEGRGRELNMRIVDKSDSYHVNSNDLPIFKDLANSIKEARQKGEPLEKRTWDREEVVSQLKGVRDDVESSIMRQTSKYYKGSLSKEEDRVHSIGDRIFYLLDKYSPSE